MESVSDGASYRPENPLPPRWKTGFAVLLLMFTTAVVAIQTIVLPPVCQFGSRVLLFLLKRFVIRLCQGLGAPYLMFQHAALLLVTF
jgi:antibiotic biosynthesis monooxygenase (ABM) superfamily enzyme